MNENFFKKLIAPTKEGMLRKELSCPKCKDPISPPIYHCDKGHSFCNTCYKSGYDCTLCGSKCSGGRTHHLERIVELYTYPCKYINKGCRKRCKIKELKAHEEGCQTFKMHCPFTSDTDCRNIGNRQQTVFHCQLVHTNRIFVGKGPIKFYITDQFIDNLTEIQQKISSLKRKKKKILCFYMLYVEETIFKCVCQFELEYIKVAMYRVSSPSEVEDTYEFVMFFHNDDNTPEAIISHECGTIGGKPHSTLFENAFVKINVEILKSCRYCTVQILARQ